MTEKAKILGVTVTHNSSQFVELMLRTLFATNDLSGFNFEMNVLDNNSAPSELPALSEYLTSHGISLTATGGRYYVAAEQHGATLTDFIARRPDPTYYLFLDADMWFIEPDTIGTMLTELMSARSSTFAVQARINGYYIGRVYEGVDGRPESNYWEGRLAWPIEFEGRHYANRYASRCSPVCSLVENSALFRSVASTVGLAQAIRFGVGEVIYYDTFSLMTHVMATHGQGHAISSRTVNHFSQTTYLAVDRARREEDCAMLLAELRSGRGVQHPRFLTPDPSVLSGESGPG